MRFTLLHVVGCCFVVYLLVCLMGFGSWFCLFCWIGDLVFVCFGLCLLCYCCYWFSCFGVWVLFGLVWVGLGWLLFFFGLGYVLHVVVGFVVWFGIVFVDGGWLLWFCILLLGY